MVHESAIGSTTKQFVTSELCVGSIVERTTVQIDCADIDFTTVVAIGRDGTLGGIVEGQQTLTGNLTAGQHVNHAGVVVVVVGRQVGTLVDDNLTTVAYHHDVAAIDALVAIDSPLGSHVDAHGMVNRRRGSSNGGEDTRPVLVNLEVSGRLGNIRVAVYLVGNGCTLVVAIETGLRINRHIIVVSSRRTARGTTGLRSAEVARYATVADGNWLHLTMTILVDDCNIHHVERQGIRERHGDRRPVLHLGLSQQCGGSAYRRIVSIDTDSIAAADGLADTDGSGSRTHCSPRMLRVYIVYDESLLDKIIVRLLVEDDIFLARRYSQRQQA